MIEKKRKGYFTQLIVRFVRTNILTYTLMHLYIIDRKLNKNNKHLPN